MNQAENPISEALRRLIATAPRGASAALGEMLRDEFRRHHACRRRKRNAQISVLAACLAASFATFIALRPRTSNTGAGREHPPMPLPAERISAGLMELAVTQATTVAKARAPARTRKNPPTEAGRFIALPTFDPAIPIDHLEIIRLDLPGGALRLVGFPVSEEFAERRVVADVLVAQDGTPYALRLVQTSQTEEH